MLPFAFQTQVTSCHISDLLIPTSPGIPTLFEMLLIHTDCQMASLYNLPKKIKNGKGNFGARHRIPLVL
jgi:hypothetical protein